MTVLLLVLPLFVILGGLVVYASSHRRDVDTATGALSRETRRRDRADLPALVSAPSGRELERAAAHRHGSAPIERAGTTEPAPYVAPDAEHLGVTRRQFLNRIIVTFVGLALAGFGAAVLAFLWPIPQSGFGSVIQVGKITDLLSDITAGDGFFYFAAGRLWLTAYPLSTSRRPAKVYSPRAHSMEAGVTVVYQTCPAPGLPRARLPDLAVVRVPVPRLPVQPGRREAGRAGPAGHGPLLDHGGRRRAHRRHRHHHPGPAHRDRHHGPAGRGAALRELSSTRRPSSTRQTARMQLRAAGGLVVEVASDGAVTVGLDGQDWLGPGRPWRPAALGPPVAGADRWGAATSVTVVDGEVQASVRAYADRALLVFGLEATADLTGLATGRFDQPSMAWPTFTPARRQDGSAPSGLRALVFQHCEFGLPSTAGPDLDGWFLLPHRPPTGWPLLLTRDDGATLLVAPLDAFHDQTIGLNDATLRCGWHGDLEAVPAGFATELAVLAADGPRAALDAWGAMLLDAAGTVRPGRWPDALGSRPSYWTDNGSAYWYQTEPGLDVAGSIVAAVEDLRAQHVPIGAVQLDSWFYPHVDLRPFDTDEWVVPPSAMITWEERPDVLPEGITALRHRLGDPPLVAHIRHLSADSPMASDTPTWVDGDYAAPATPEAYERWLDQCQAWGVETLEHDWLVEVFFGVRGLRAEPGRATAWQEGIDRAARDRGITLQWCMGTPADLAQTTTLTQVTSVRTSGDHGYIATAGQLWAWFCTTNALARSLELMPYKDVFRADPAVAGDNGAAEALLSALSTGPVGLGDRVGRMDPTLAHRTCRADGLLIKPHTAIAAVDESMLSGPAFNPTLLVAECTSEHPAGTWVYAVAMHAQPADDPITGEIRLADVLPPSSGEVVAWPWPAGAPSRQAPDATIPIRLEREEFDYVVLAPVLATGLAVLGDHTKFVTAGDARVEITETSTGVRLVVKGAGETVTITGWAERGPTSSQGRLQFEPSTNQWFLEVEIPSRGWAAVTVEA